MNTAPPSAVSGPGPESPAPWEWGVVVLAAALLVGLRLHAFDLPLENDECNYAYIGARLLEGDALYVDVWDHQPPGVFMLYGGAIALFGDEPHVFRWMTTAFALACLILIYRILFSMAGAAAALGGAMLFAVLSTDPGTAGEGCNREIYLNALILAAWYLAGRGIHDRTTWRYYGAGSMLALASLIKTIVAVHWLALAVWIVFASLSRASRTAKACMAPRLLAVTIPPAVLWIATFAYFGLTQRMSAFVEAVLQFNLSYSSGASLFTRLLQFFDPPRHGNIFDGARPVWLAGAGATAWLFMLTVWKRDRQAALIAFLVLASFAAVCLPGRFWPHYYHLLIPPLVLAIALGLGKMHRLVGSGMAAESSRDDLDSSLRRIGTRLESIAPESPVPHKLVRQLIAPALGAFVFAVTLNTQYHHYIRRPPFGLTVHRYNSRDFWGRAQGENVRRVTDPDDRIFVFGNDAEIYYYSQRRCASRFTMITGIQSAYAGADERRRILMEELRAAPPRLIVVLFDEEPFEEWLTFLRELYGEPAGWDLHDRSGEPIMFVFARKDAPIEPIDWDWDRADVGGWFPNEPGKGR